MVSKVPWLEKQLQNLVIDKKEIDSLAKISEGIYSPARVWAPLKLVFLKYVADIYTSIIPKWKSNMYYIDLFSGSGINKIKETKDFCLGSPLLIAKKVFSKNQFKKMFFCENNPEYSRALRLRLEKDVKKENFNIFPGDCNKNIGRIINELEDDHHSLIFVDPYCMEITWRSIEKILELESDILFTFQNLQIQRAKTFGNFFKDNNKALEIRDAAYVGEIGTDLMRLYINDIIEKREPKESIIETVRIQGKSFHYHMIFITKKTRAGSPWMRGIISGKKQIENNTSDAVKWALDVLTGRQKTLIDI